MPRSKAAKLKISIKKEAAKLKISIKSCEAENIDHEKAAKLKISNMNAPL